MLIQVLGSGCQKCNDLYEQAQAAAARLGSDVTVEKIGDVDVFFRLGVTRTPALAVDDEVLSMGKALEAEEIVALVRAKRG